MFICVCNRSHLRLIGRKPDALAPLFVVVVVVVKVVVCRMLFDKKNQLYLVQTVTGLEFL